MGMAAVSKYLGSGQTRTRVPVFLRPTGSSSCRGVSTSPPAKINSCVAPSRQTRTSSLLDKALVTDTPTPCRPPEKARSEEHTYELQSLMRNSYAVFCLKKKNKKKKITHT